MSEEQLRKLINESLRSGISEIGVSVEDQELDTDEFEDSFYDYEDEDENYDINLGLEPMPISSVDMPIQDKAYLKLGGEESFDDEFSDLNGYKEFGDGTDDYEGNWQDDVSVSPGYFNENVVKITKQQLQSMVKEGVIKLHKQTLIENRLEEINSELNALNNPQAWEDARNNAQSELAKKNIAWQEITEKIKLINECSPPNFDEYGVPDYLAGAPLLPKDIAIKSAENLKKMQEESVLKRKLGITPGSDADKNFKTQTSK